MPQLREGIDRRRDLLLFLRDERLPAQEEAEKIKRKAFQKPQTLKDPCIKAKSKNKIFICRKSRRFIINSYDFRASQKHATYFMRSVFDKKIIFGNHQKIRKFFCRRE